ncbi:MAG: patatin-like phospholipase family protein, partial [Burkholderiaceae bacterium]
MSLDTVITSSLLTPARPTAHRDTTALVLMGGGARTAYQAGVLKALSAILARASPDSCRLFPFQLVVGTSAGALNATYLASQADKGLEALTKLAGFWQTLHSERVYQLDTPAWARTNKLLAAWALHQQVNRHRALLDNTPLVNTLHNAIDLPQVDVNLRNQCLDGLAVTASSYSTGVHWTFCQTGSHHPAPPWGMPDRRAEMQPITIEHLMASAAIPFLFRAVPLWVNGHK